MTDAAADRGTIRMRDYVRFDPQILIGFVPVAVFLIANALGPAQIAIGLSFVASCIVFVKTPGRGATRLLSVTGFAIVTVSAVVGIITDNDRVFVAQNIGIDLAFAVMFGVSVLVGKPLIGVIAREAAPGIQPVLSLADPVFVRLTLLNVAINLIEASLRVVMLFLLEANVYAVVSRVTAVPVTILFVAFCYREIFRRAVAIWPVDEPPPTPVNGGA